MALYNIALLPMHKQTTIIKLAHEFKFLKYRYLLGDHSLPHVTLAHFNADENIETIWENLMTIVPKKTLKLEFKEFSYTSFDNKIFWISLIPDQGEWLNQLHVKVIELLKLKPKRNFDPHLTLLNTIDKTAQKYIDSLAKKYQPISDEFQLSLGKRDEVGQYTQVIFTPQKG